MVCMRVWDHMDTHFFVLRSLLSKKRERHWPRTDFKSAQTDRGMLLCLRGPTGISGLIFLSIG